MVTPKTKILKGGMSMDAPKYSEPVRRFAVEQIKNRQSTVDIPVDTVYHQCHAHGSNMEKGVRFNDDLGILWRLESQATEEEFMADPILTVDSALMDAAASDYWYTHEKDYGEHDEEVNEDDE